MDLDDHVYLSFPGIERGVDVTGSVENNGVYEESCRRHPQGPPLPTRRSNGIRSNDSIVRAFDIQNTDMSMQGRNSGCFDRKSLIIVTVLSVLLITTILGLAISLGQCKSQTDSNSECELHCHCIFTYGSKGESEIVSSLQSLGLTFLFPAKSFRKLVVWYVLPYGLEKSFVKVENTRNYYLQYNGRIFRIKWLNPD